MFETPDMTLVTFLRMRGHEPTSVFTRGRRCLWTFDNTEDLEDLILDYQYRQANVDASDFSESYKTTLNEMHDARREASV